MEIKTGSPERKEEESLLESIGYEMTKVLEQKPSEVWLPMVTQVEQAWWARLIWLASVLILAVGAGCTPVVITRDSVSSAGEQANADSCCASISRAGGLLAFASDASNLVDGDNNRVRDVFVRNRATLVTTRISVGLDGEEANGESSNPFLSPDGQLVAFWSRASNLIRDDNNSRADVFVYDMRTGTTTRASVRADGVEADGDSLYPSISSDGNLVAFWSEAINLVDNDHNAAQDMFVRNMTTGTITRVSVSSGGVEGNGNSYGRPHISSDGRFVAFYSAAFNLVDNDSNGQEDVFVYNLMTGETTRVSVNSVGEEANGASTNLSITSNGSLVVFYSAASNLVGDDDNGGVFIHDRDTGQVTRVSRGGAPAISFNGRFVAFDSYEALVDDDHNEKADVFVYDRTVGTTTRSSVDSAGVEGNDHSFTASVSEEGGFVAFLSSATNLVEGDTNKKVDIFVRRR